MEVDAGSRPAAGQCVRPRVDRLARARDADRRRDAVQGRVDRFASGRVFTTAHAAGGFTDLRNGSCVGAGGKADIDARRRNAAHCDAAEFNGDAGRRNASRRGCDAACAADGDAGRWCARDAARKADVDTRGANVDARRTRNTDVDARRQGSGARDSNVDAGRRRTRDAARKAGVAPRGRSVREADVSAYRSDVDARRKRARDATSDDVTDIRRECVRRGVDRVGRRAVRGARRIASD